MNGAYAEYASIPEDNVVPIPDSMSFEEAVCFPATLTTAWHMLVVKAKIQPNETVLLWGATSGLGIMGIQVAKLFNAKVIAVAGTEEKCEMARSLGADYTINYKEKDVFREVRRITNKKGVDVVFEHTGVSTWETSIMSMSYGGRLVTCGNTTGYDAKLDLRMLFWKQLNLLGCHAGTKADLLKSLQFAFSGQIKAVIDEVIPLSQAAMAHQKFEDGDKIGKIVLVPDFS